MLDGMDESDSTSSSSADSVDDSDRDPNYKLSNRRAIGEHTSTAVNCIPPAEVALNLAFGDFERNGDIYGHWGEG